MVSHFLATYDAPIWWSGVLLGSIGSIWFLFASYHCDVALARWTMVLPPIGLILVIRHPEECLKPFLVCVLSTVMMWAGEAYAPHSASDLPKLDLPESISN